MAFEKNHAALFSPTNNPMTYVYVVGANEKYLWDTNKRGVYRGFGSSVTMRMVVAMVDPAMGDANECYDG